MTSPVSVSNPDIEILNLGAALGSQPVSDELGNQVLRAARMAYVVNRSPEGAQPDMGGLMNDNLANKYPVLLAANQKIKAIAPEESAYDLQVMSEMDHFEMGCDTMTYTLSFCRGLQPALWAMKQGTLGKSIRAGLQLAANKDTRTVEQMALGKRFPAIQVLNRSINQATSKVVERADLYPRRDEAFRVGVYATLFALTEAI